MEFRHIKVKSLRYRLGLVTFATKVEQKSMKGYFVKSLYATLYLVHIMVYDLSYLMGVFWRLVAADFFGRAVDSFGSGLVVTINLIPSEI